MALNGKLEFCREALEPCGFHLCKTEYMESKFNKTCVGIGLEVKTGDHSPQVT